jgi:signal transduction histidine kinase/streptogramin lyase
VGTDNGLCQFNKETGKFKRYANDPDDPSSLSGNHIRAIFQDSRGKLWIGAAPGGLNVLNPESNRFARFQYDPLKSASLSSDMVFHVGEDRQGNIWVGTLEGGVNYSTHYNSKRFLVYRSDPFNSNSLNVNSIHAIELDGNGNLWVGTDGGGLYGFHRTTGQVINYQNKPGVAGSIGSNSVMCLLEDSRGDFWAGEYNGGLSKLNKANGSFINYRYQENNPTGISNSDVRCLFEDSRKNFWIATNGGGINLFDRDGRTFTHFKHDSANENSISSDWCLTIHEDRKGMLWFGTYWGLNRYDPRTRVFTRFFNDRKDKTTISNNWIYCFLEDSKGNFWVGTYYGLNLYHPLTGTFTSYTQEDGLPNDVINGILEDGKGYLWVSTDKGLVQFDPQTKSCVIYDSQDGLAGDQFNHGACKKSPSGRLFFGGVDGLTGFAPDEILLNTHVPPVAFTGLIVNNKQTSLHRFHAPLRGNLDEMKEITLTPDESMVTFQFSALNFVNPEKNQYAFMMEGFDKQWNVVGSKREATYTNLDPGDYVFHVKASNNDGVWNETGTSIRVFVLPPWWKTWWFRIGLIGVLGLTVFMVVELRLGSVKRHRRRLAVEVEQRTRELNEANRLLSKSNAELEQFAYVASHDLQEPLRMVNSYMGLLSRRYQDQLDQDAKEFIGFAMDGSKRMQQLISDLLAYSRVSTQGKPFESTDCEEAFKCVAQNLQIAIEESGATVTHDALPTVMADRIQLERLLQNLVGNAIKYCDKGIVPAVHVSAEQIDGEWTFSIRDNGIGIDPKHFDRIFGIFQRLHTRDQYSGTGIGLAVCKKIVERHKGRIWVESEEGKGSTFFFTLPVDNPEAT